MVPSVRATGSEAETPDTCGSVMAAIILIRPPQPGQRSASTSKNRFRRSAHASRRASDSLPSPPSAAPDDRHPRRKKTRAAAAPKEPLPSSLRPGADAPATLRSAESRLCLTGRVTQPDSERPDELRHRDSARAAGACSRAFASCERCPPNRHASLHGIEQCRRASARMRLFIPALAP